MALVAALKKPITGERDLWHHSGSWMKRVSKEVGGTTWIRRERKEEGDQKNCHLEERVTAAEAGEYHQKAQEKPSADFRRNCERFRT